MRKENLPTYRVNDTDYLDFNTILGVLNCSRSYCFKILNDNNINKVSYKNMKLYNKDEFLELWKIRELNKVLREKSSVDDIIDVFKDKDILKYSKTDKEYYDALLKLIKSDISDLENLTMETIDNVISNLEDFKKISKKINI